MQDPLLFSLTVLLILGTPGPTNTLLATAGATVGFRRALPLLPAEAAGYLIAILAIGLALGPFVAGVPAVAMGLRLAVGTYLALLAVKLWRRGPVDLSVMPVTPRQVFVTTLLNPKAIVFALGVIPFGATPWWPWMLGFLGLLSGVALGWIGLGTLLGRAAGAAGRAGLVPKLGAAAVGAFALVLVVGPLLR
ncbi:LysE family translocator [Muricoccus aerilatus]|uniref:LysE family translocator n=1 Tax=Muricoccus aerilatus TaxID=452982 RepID=UPI0005C1FC95|nr:lysine transporter LysE [Roseomonas aerilata]